MTNLRQQKRPAANNTCHPP